MASEVVGCDLLIFSKWLLSVFFESLCILSKNNSLKIHLEILSFDDPIMAKHAAQLADTGFSR